MNITVSSTSLNPSASAYHLTGTAKTGQSETAAKAAEEESRVSATSIEGDTLELSEAGLAANAGSEADAEDTAAEGSVTAKVVSDAFSETEGTDAEEDFTADLSSYTESELKEMYQNGEITAAEYKQELARRETESGETGEDISSRTNILSQEN